YRGAADRRQPASRQHDAVPGCHLHHFTVRHLSDAVIGVVMSSPFVAEIRIFACNFAPTGWAQCNGQLLPISQNTALFSLLGTFYGGDGKSTFALPNFDGSAAMNQGDGAGLSQRFLGESGGEQTVTLLQAEMPIHTHSVTASNQIGKDRTPGGEDLARSKGMT